MIGDTLADPENPVALPRITVDEPAISMVIGTNTSPLVGRVKGHKLTARMVKTRLDSELVGNVSLRVLDIGRPDAWEVQGRGELALAILVEQMRREGFELTVGKPQVVTRTIDGKLHELRGADHRQPRGAPRRHHPAAREPQGQDGPDDQPGHRLGSYGVHHPVARSDRFPYRLPHGDPRHRHFQRHLPRLRAVGRRDPRPPHGFARLRPCRLGHPVRDDPARRPRHLLRRTGQRHLRGHVVGINRAPRTSTSTSPARRSSPTCALRPPT